MANTIKIVLSGYYGFDNIGDEAVLYSIITALRNEIENVELIVLSNNPEKTKALYNVKSVNRWKLSEVAKVIKESDLLVSGGGSLLQQNQQNQQPQVDNTQSARDFSTDYKTFMAMSDDLVGRIEDQERQIDNLTYESTRYKMMYEDLYNTYIYPQEADYEEGNNNE